MNALLDTHSFLWWVTDDPRLSTHAHDVIGDGNNRIFFSAASGWEIAIKAQLGKLPLASEPAQFVTNHLAINAFEVMAIELRHTLQTYNLPMKHRDPFDRILVAQSQLERMPIITSDPLIMQYEVDVIW